MIVNESRFSNFLQGRLVSTREREDDAATIRAPSCVNAIRFLRKESAASTVGFRHPTRAATPRL